VQQDQEEDAYLRETKAYNIGVPARPLPPAVSDASAPDIPPQPPRTLSPLHISRISPRKNSPPRASSPPAREVGGTVYHHPLLLPQTHIPQNDVFVYRSQSFLPAATRPPTRQAKAAAADVAAQALSAIACNGPALDRFPLSVQGGLSAGQVKRAYAPAYEARALGQEKQPLSQTWLVPNRIAAGEAHDLCITTICVSQCDAQLQNVSGHPL